MFNNFVSVGMSSVIITPGWVNPEEPATPLTGYRKRAASASDSGAIHIVSSSSQTMGAFVF
jgi:hypothetical protein